MGAGASVDYDQELMNEKIIAELMKNEEARSTLFKHIDEFKMPGEHAHIKGKIGLIKTVAYFMDPKNTLYPGFKVNADIINEAIKHVLRKKDKKMKKSKNSKHIKDEMMTLKDFHAFVPILLLFQKLFKVFDSVDNLIVPDQRILKGEWMRIRTHLDTVDGLQLLDPSLVTEEMWLQGWDEMNVDKNEFVSFHEACEYTLNHVHDAFNYLHKEVDDIDHDISDPNIILGTSAKEKSAAVSIDPESTPSLEPVSESTPSEPTPSEPTPIEPTPIEPTPIEPEPTQAE